MGATVPRKDRTFDSLVRPEHRDDRRVAKAEVDRAEEPPSDDRIRTISNVSPPAAEIPAKSQGPHSEDQSR